MTQMQTYTKKQIVLELKKFIYEGLGLQTACLNSETFNELEEGAQQVVLMALQMELISDMEERGEPKEQIYDELCAIGL
jgi:hypothetical protein